MSTLPAAPEEGRLRAYPLPRLLLVLCQTRHNGVLELSQDRKHKRVLFCEGAPVSCTSSLASEGLGAQLADAGVISRLDYSKLQNQMSKSGCSEGVAILSLKLLDAKGLLEALRDHVRRNVVEAFGWPDADFRVSCDEQAPKEIQPLRSDPYALVQEGLETHWSPDRLLQDLSTRMNEYALPAPSLAKVAARFKKDTALEELLESLDGSQSFGRVVGACLASPRALAAAWVMCAADLLRFQAAPATSGGDADKVELDAPAIEISVASTDAVEEAASKPSPIATEKESARAKQMSGEVFETLSRLDDLNHYEILGVQSDAKIAEIKKAYFSAAKRYHPDTLNRLGLEEIRREASMVFSSIAQAYEVLGNTLKRRNYDASLLDDGPEIDTQALAQAEKLYRKGEILVKMGDFRGALEYLAPAVELWPDETEYQAALGWAYFKKSPPDPESARNHLEEAVRIAPQDAVSHFRLGVVLRALGEEKAGAQAISRAKSLDPSVDA